MSDKTASELLKKKARIGFEGNDIERLFGFCEADRGMSSLSGGKLFIQDQHFFLLLCVSPCVFTVYNMCYYEQHTLF